MGQIACWGMAPGQAATTGNLIALSTIAGLEYMTTNLIAHTSGRWSTLEAAFVNQQAEEHVHLLDVTNTGIEALVRLARSNLLTADNMKDYTLPILKDRLDLLVGPHKKQQAFDEMMLDIMPKITGSAKLQYDHIWIDVNSDLTNPLTEQVMLESDLIVVNLNQNIHVLERFFAMREGHPILEKVPFVLVLGQYDRHSKYTVNNIARRFKYKQPIYTVPHCAEFLDAWNDQQVLDFFVRNRHVKKGHPNYFFINEVQRFARGTLSRLGVDTDLLSEGQG
ncbi:chromosome partitioning protein ParA [Paenibacillus sp. N1-5-1-14]|uniref:chromosome partitioning protein ParA n=1 Tax=Paenibacillus radicibacter TaxID=2972488 RepID=UPI00215953EE|nr:chromosome partitioning protein ParA [Paenibacillus radicibacter]MCR8642104.1 chromosome partitioning protein ParA [Paenibacillus radicibacter]